MDGLGVTFVQFNALELSNGHFNGDKVFALLFHYPVQGIANANVCLTNIQEQVLQTV